MPKLKINGNQLEIGLEQFLELISNTAVSAVLQCETVYAAQALGFPDSLKEVHIPYLSKSLDLLHEIGPKIEDIELQNCVRVLRHNIISLIELDKSLVELIKKITAGSDEELSPRLLDSSLQSMDADNLPVANVSPPEWMGNEEFQSVLLDSDQVVESIAKTFEQFVQVMEALRDKLGSEKTNQNEKRAIDRLSQLLSLLGGLSYSHQNDERITPSVQNDLEPPKNISSIVDSDHSIDQMAKDLVDAAEGKIDPESAIRLFKQALEIKGTGIQAYKANFGLALRYDELGDRERSIQYFNQAIEIDPSSPLALFWRGRVHFHLGNYTEARSDIIHALNLSQSDAASASINIAGAEEILAKIDEKDSYKEQSTNSE